MAIERWTREQLIKGLSLYCRIPFGKVHHSNPDIQALAQTIGRTDSAVSMKLSNFASFDPELKDRGIMGLSGASALDREIWDEYYGRWESLADVVDISTDSIPYQTDLSFTTTEVERTVTTRRGQAFFRKAVFAGFDEKCCLTGIQSPGLLRASHIIPWSVEPTLRLDPRNGLCLNALHDAAFDRGLITFTGDYELVVSDQLQKEIPDRVYHEMFELQTGKPFMPPERFKTSQSALEFHQKNIYCG